MIMILSDFMTHQKQNANLMSEPGSEHIPEGDIDTLILSFSRFMSLVLSPEQQRRNKCER
jgi:hypothetical protein